MIGTQLEDQGSEIASVEFGWRIRMQFLCRIVTVPEAAPGLKKIAQDRLKWLDGQMEGRDFVCGKRFSLADILLYCFIDFGGQVGQPLDASDRNLAAWFARVKERPSAKA